MDGGGDAGVTEECDPSAIWSVVCTYYLQSRLARERSARYGMGPTEVNPRTSKGAAQFQQVADFGATGRLTRPNAARPAPCFRSTGMGLIENVVHEMP